MSHPERKTLNVILSEDRMDVPRRYDRAGYAVLPKGERGWSFMHLQMGVPLSLLLPLSLTPVVFGRAGFAYLATTVILGAGFLYLGYRLALKLATMPVG